MVAKKTAKKRPTRSIFANRCETIRKNIENVEDEIGRILSGQHLAYLFFLAILLMCLIPMFVGCRRQTTPSGSQQLEESQERTFTIEPGLEDDAFAYYKQTFDEFDLNPQHLERQALVDSQNLAKALDFLGYKDLDPKDAEGLSSGELMKKFPDKILSAAFFAPKITDVSVVTGGSESKINLGWRKVVRFTAHGKAAEKGIGAGYLLFNKFQGAGSYNNDPFKKDDPSIESQNTQLILTRAEVSTLKRPLYFLVFGSNAKGAPLITFLLASFDARAPEIVPLNKYYVPNACAECHGGKILQEDDWKKVKLNYLDTDHWFDRIEDDFAVLKTGTCGKTDGCAVLYDGGKDETKPDFKAAFDIFRQLNREIKVQNEKVEPSPSPTPTNPSFQLRAVTKWLELHETDSSHKDVFARALPSTLGDSWTADTAPDKELLPLLNQYCFRCHSSVKFNIFDRPKVASIKGKIFTNLNRPVCDLLSMPQDRNLNCSEKALADKTLILRLVCDLPGKPCLTPSPTPTPTCPGPSPTPCASPKPTP